MKHFSPININQLKPSLGMINFFMKHLLKFIDNSNQSIHYFARRIWCRLRSNFKKKKLILIDAGLLIHYDNSSSNHGQLWHDLYKRLATVKKDYNHLVKKFLTLIYAVCKFHQHLWGQKFMVIDHKLLIWLLGTENLTSAACIQGCDLIFSTSNCKLDYKSDHLSENSVTDFKALSIPAKEKRCFINKEHCIWFV